MLDGLYWILVDDVEKGITEVKMMVADKLLDAVERFASHSSVLSTLASVVFSRIVPQSIALAEKCWCDVCADGRERICCEASGCDPCGLGC